MKNINKKTRKQERSEERKIDTEIDASRIAHKAAAKFSWVAEQAADGLSGGRSVALRSAWSAHQMRDWSSELIYLTSQPIYPTVFVSNYLYPFTCRSLYPLNFYCTSDPLIFAFHPYIFPVMHFSVFFVSICPIVFHLSSFYSPMVSVNLCI